METRQKNRNAVAAMLLLAVCLLPIMVLGWYNHPTGDDYFYGLDARLAWKETGSRVRTLGAAFQGVAKVYQVWQGTYSAMLLMHLPPQLFGDNAYRFVTTVILLMLVGSVFYLLKIVICDKMGGAVQLWIFCSSILALLWIETVKFQGESFFWYNGSMYYTGYFAVTLFFWGLLLRCLFREYHPWSRATRWAALGFLAVFLAGGNYVTLLPCLILLVTAAVYFIWKRDRRAVGVGVLLFLMAAGFLVSALAPGNEVRQNGMWRIPAWKAVAKSLLQGLHYFRVWTDGWWFLAALSVTPFLWRQLKKIRFAFPCPLLVAGFLFGVFCSMSCPLYFTMNSPGPARALAVVYYAYDLFSMIAYVYLLGYLSRRADGAGRFRKILLKIQSAGQRGWNQYKKLCVAAYAMALILLLSAQILSGAVKECTTYIALDTLVSGEARAYDQEYRWRLSILEGDGAEDLVFQSYEHKPPMLYVGDFSGDPLEPYNVRFAQYFGKASVWIDYSEQ